MPRLDGKVAVITGAGTGIGRATAKLFAQEGAKVVVAELNAEAGEQTAQLIAQAGGEAIAIRTDVTEPDSIQSTDRQGGAALRRAAHPAQQRRRLHRCATAT